MKFEKDLFTLYFRIILILILSVTASTLVNHFFKISIEIQLEPYWIFLFAFLFAFTTIYFLTYTVEISKRKLILKNIFGITINNLNLKKPYSRKIKQRNIQYEGELLIGLFIKKYRTVTDIRFESKIEKNKFHINGHIFSKRGLVNFIKETKK